MPNFIEYLRDIINVKYPDIVAKYNTIMGINPLGLDGKVDKVTGKGLSTNDYITLDKDKLAALNSALYEKLAFKGLANGYAPLGADGKIDPSFLNSLNMVDIWVVADQASMLAQASAGKGDWAIRSDLNNAAFMLINLPSSTLTNWLPLNFNATVTSVNGHTGIVVLGANDVGLGLVDNTADIDKPISTAQAQALALKASIDSSTGVLFLPGGTTAQRPILAANVYGTRFNSDLNIDETWNGTLWVSNSTESMDTTLGTIYEGLA